MEPLFGGQLGIQVAVYTEFMSAPYRGVPQSLTSRESGGLPRALEPDRFLF